LVLVMMFNKGLYLYYLRAVGGLGCVWMMSERASVSLRTFGPTAHFRAHGPDVGTLFCWYPL
jgi:hypothetical protein